MICCSYNPNKYNISKHIKELNKSIDLFSSLYDDFLLMGDFNVVLDNAVSKDFYNLYIFASLINKATCILHWPSSNKLLKYFQNSSVIETGLFNFHKIVVTVMKKSFQKLKPKILNCRNYRYFSKYRFREKVTSELSKLVLENSDKGFNNFHGVCKEALNIYAPLKKRYRRGTNSLFMNRILSKGPE